jgi:uncharacterized protein
VTALQVIQHAPGHSWQPGVAFRDQTGIGEHLATLQGWLAAGQLVMGGPFLDGGGGGMAVVRFPDVAAAESAAQDDPAVRTGLLVASVRPWLAGLSVVDL